MASQGTDGDKMNALIEALGESVLQASDEEILEELREDGIDPKDEAARLKTMMLDTVKAYSRRMLEASRAAYDQRIEQVSQKSYVIPVTPEERRSLFALITQRPQFAQFVTAQFRDLGELTDTDIETYLEDLDELGILAEFQRGDSDEG